MKVLIIAKEFWKYFSWAYMLAPAQTYQKSRRSNLRVCFWALVSSKNAKIRLRPSRSKKNESKILLIAGIKLKWFTRKHITRYDCFGLHKWIWPSREKRLMERHFRDIFTRKGKVFSQGGKFGVSKKKVVIIIGRYESHNRV